MQLVAEIHAAPAAGAESVYLFGTSSWATGPADTPPDSAVRALLQQAGNYTRTMGNGSTLFGAAATGYGAARLQNGGALDAFARYGFGWRQYRLLAAPDDAAPPSAYPSGWTVLMVATIDSVRADRMGITFNLRDRLALLEKPVCAQYAGTGNEEGPATLAGQPKPRVYGSACNFEPVLVDASNNIYQVSDKPFTEPHWVWDKRAALTPTSNATNEVADFVALQGATVAVGCFSRLSNSGMFKLNAAPSGRLTVDAIRHNASYSPTFGRPRLGEVLYDIATDAGLTSADIDASLSSLAVPGPSHGYVVKDASTTYLDVLGAVAASAGAWVGFNRLGVLTAGLVAAPSGTAVWTFTASNSTEIDLDDGLYPVPISKATVRGGRNWGTMQPSELASGVAELDREALAQEYTYIETASNAIAAKHLNAPAVTFDTLSGPAGAAAATVRPVATVGFSPATVLGLFGVERLWPRVRTGISAALLAAVDIGSVVSLRWGRYGLSAGQLFRVWRIDVDFRANRATFWLWG